MSKNITIPEAITMLQEAMKKEFGENAKLEDGDSITGVFNDAVMTLSNENNEIKLDIKAGEPYKFDCNLNLLEEKGENKNGK